MKELNISFILCVISAIPMTLYVSTHTTYLIPLIAAITSNVFFNTQSINGFFVLNYKTLTTNTVVVLNTIVILLIPHLINKYELSEVLYNLFLFMEYVTFVIYMVILQELIYKFSHQKHNDICV